MKIDTILTYFRRFVLGALIFNILVLVASAILVLWGLPRIIGHSSLAIIALYSTGLVFLLIYWYYYVFSSKAVSAEVSRRKWWRGVLILTSLTILLGGLTIIVDTFQINKLELRLNYDGSGEKYGEIRCENEFYSAVVINRYSYCTIEPETAVTNGYIRLEYIDGKIDFQDFHDLKFKPKNPVQYVYIELSTNLNSTLSTGKPYDASNRILYEHEVSERKQNALIFMAIIISTALLSVPLAIREIRDIWDK